MKKLICILVVAGIAEPVRAQWPTRDVFGSAVWGGLIGGIIGHNHHGQTAEGVAIGAGAGLLLGALANADRPSYGYAAPPYRYGTTSYAGTGAILGGIAGGVIGHNHHRQTAEGIAIGAASGMILGAMADQATRTRSVNSYAVTEVPAVVSAPVVSVSNSTVQTLALAPAAVPASPPSSPMASANSLFGR